MKSAYSKKLLQKIFINATNVTLSKIKIKPYKKKYHHCTIAGIRRSNKMIFHIYMLLTDKGKENELKYLDCLKGKFGMILILNTQKILYLNYTIGKI